LEIEHFFYNSVNDLAISYLQQDYFAEAGEMFDLCFGKYHEWGNQDEMPYEYGKYYQRNVHVPAPGWPATAIEAPLKTPNKNRFSNRKIGIPIQLNNFLHETGSTRPSTMATLKVVSCHQIPNSKVGWVAAEAKHRS
jgi:hypothetical protein